MRKLLAFAVSVGLAAGCSKTNPHYCPGNPDDNCLIDADIDQPMGCTTSAQCTNAAKPVCDTAQKVCVACTASEAGACSGTTPVCSATNTCTACTAHDQCDSNVCLPDGSCANETQVAYVSSTGTGDDCTKAAPCALLKEAIARNLSVVKIAANGAGLDSSTTVIDGKAVTILAEKGAKLDRNGDGVILEVRSANADVRIYDLEITGATGLSGGDGIRLEPNGGLPSLRLTRTKVANNQGLGLSMLGGTLTVAQSTFSNNTGGGINVLSGTFKISGNMFFSNGADSTAVGGIAIASSQGTSNRLDFNSFNKNKTQDGKGSAIECGGTLAARNNIMSGNGTLSNSQQVGGNCTHSYSIVRPGTVPSGTGNGDADPMFVNTTTGDLHIMPGSPALGAADPASDLTDIAAKDLDGDARVSPADIGADEVP